MEGLNDVLNWLTGADAGAFLIVSGALAWAFEDWATWQRLKPKVKAIVILGLSGSLAIGATMLSANPDLVASIDPFFRPFMTVLLAWLATQAAHKVNPKRAENQVKDWSKDPGGSYNAVG